MAIFDKDTTSAQVVAAFSQQVKGRVFVITGASQPSIGSSIAIELAKASPAHIVIASRTASTVDPVLAAICETDPSVMATFVQLDLSDHDSVRRGAQLILAATGSTGIDVLINSAGNMALKEFTVDKQGIEMQMSVNHAGHFLLTNLLVPALLSTGGGGTGGPSHGGGAARVVNISSAGYQISPVRYEDPNFSDGKTYDPWTAYGQAKTAQILFAYGLNSRLQTRGNVKAFACHPGSNLDTRLGSHLVVEDYSDIPAITTRNTGREFLFTIDDEPRFKTYEQIAATPLIAALDPDLAAPAYLQNNRVVQPAAEHAYASEHVDRCWKLSEELVGQKFEY